MVGEHISLHRAYKKGKCMKNKEDLIKEHKEEYCKNCKIEKCEGIYTTLDNKTRCNRNENWRMHEKNMWLL